MKCEHCRQQLLPLLYDLLEPLERETVAVHLEGCAECRDALKAAQEQQGILAEAVKEKHAELVFKAPSKATPASTAPTVLMHRPPRRHVLLNRWAIAASILLVLFSAGSIIGWNFWREQADAFQQTQIRLAQAKDEMAKSQEALNQKKSQTQKEIRAIQEQIDTLFTNWKKEETKTRKVIEDQGAQLIIKGPMNALAGAKNNYEVEMRQEKLPGDLAQQQLNQIVKVEKNAKGEMKGQTNFAPQLNVRAFNQNNETLFEQNLRFQNNARANFELPSNLPIKPGDTVALEFQTQGADGKLVTLRDNLKLVFPDYVTHLTTDRPLYRPGDTVRFRSLTLERFSLKPAQQPFHLRYRIVGPGEAEVFTKEVVSQVVAGPNNEPIRGPKGEVLHGFGVGDFELPTNLPGGQYTLFVNEVNERFHEEKRTFLVNRLQSPRYSKELSFHRKSYNAGDQLKMNVRVVPVQGLPAGVLVFVRIAVDGVDIMSQSMTTDNEGRLAVECGLPKQFVKGIGTVTLDCIDGDRRETIVRNIPLVVRDLQIEFYPEGGELVAGVPNRVYFLARTPVNKPANFTGRIVDEEDREVARLQTASDEKEPGVNQGLGHFTYTPEAKKNYKVRIDTPVGIERTMALPPAKENGVALHLPQGVVENEINVVLHSGQTSRELLVGAYCRGRMLDHKFVKAAANRPAHITLRPMAGVGGVYRITVYEKVGVGAEVAFRPLAERLIFRKNTKRVNVAISSDRASYQPGEMVQLTLSATNEQKAFVPAVALVAVVDTSVLKQANEKITPGLPGHFLLATEVRNPEELEYAEFLLGDHPKAAASLDLLLGCQGWRRFAEQDPQKFQERQQQAKAPVFLANSAQVSQFLDAEQKQIEKLDQAFVRQALELHKKLAESEKQEEGPRDLHQAIDSKQGELEQAQSIAEQSESQMREFHAFFIQFVLGGFLITLLFVGFLLISVGLRRLSDGDGCARSWLASGVALLGVLFVVSVVGTFTFMGDHFVGEFRDHRKRPLKVAAGPAKGVAVQRVEKGGLVEQLEMNADDDRLLEVRPKRIGEIEEAKHRDAGVQVANNLQGAPLNVDANHFVPLNEEQEERLMRQQGNYQALLLRSLGRRVPLPAARDSAMLRVYAHQHQPLADAGRQDFAETLYWHPVLVMADGKAQVQFDLSDAVTGFQVLVLSQTFDGRLGTDRIEITSKRPVPGKGNR